MKLSKVALCLIASTQVHSVWADTTATEDNYLCGNRITGQAEAFGQAFYACDVAPFGDVDFVEQKLNTLVFQDTASDESDYINALYPVLRDAANYYFDQRNAEVDDIAQEKWQNAVLALAQQSSFWSHYRQGEDGLLKMARGDSGHGHGLMQIDDRDHFVDVTSGKGWHIFENISFALDSFYPHWVAGATNACVIDANDETGLAQAQYAFAAYTSGDVQQACRWNDEATNDWADLDADFAEKYTTKVWFDYVEDKEAPAAINTACFMMGDEGCIPVGELPAPKADIGSTGRIYGETYYGSPNTIAGCRMLPDRESPNVEWIRTTTNAYATYSVLNLLAREGDFVQVSFDYKGLLNVCWTPEDAITWDGFEPPAPENDILYAYKLLELSSGETCLHNNGEFHCVTQAKDAICLTETLNEVVEPTKLVLSEEASNAQEKIIYDRHECLPVVNDLFSVGQSIELVKDAIAYDQVGGVNIGTLIAGSSYQVLDMVANTKYKEHRYYKVQLEAAYTIPAYVEGEGDDAIEHPEQVIPAVTGYFYAGTLDDQSDYVIAATESDPVVLSVGQNLKVTAELGVKMMGGIGAADVLTIPQGTVLTVNEVSVVGDNNNVYYGIHRKGIDGVLFAGTLANGMDLVTDFAITSEPATVDNTPDVPTQDTPQSKSDGGSIGIFSLLLTGLVFIRRKFQ